MAKLSPRSAAYRRVHFRDRGGLLTTLKYTLNLKAACERHCEPAKELSVVLVNLYGGMPRKAGAI